MLPYTTYHIPESPENQTPLSAKWLFFFHNEPITPEKNELLRKIAIALQADFDLQVDVIQQDALDPISFHDRVARQHALVVSFGIKPAQVGLWIDLTNVGLRLLESHAFILTHSLSDLEKTPAYKKSLWQDMQLYLSATTHAK